jgi:hypothetical protein
MDFWFGQISERAGRRRPVVSTSVILAGTVVL